MILAFGCFLLISEEYSSAGKHHLGGDEGLGGAGRDGV